jgi:Leucine-rich repeat (LRR) protein
MPLEAFEITMNKENSNTLLGSMAMAMTITLGLVAAKNIKLSGSRNRTLYASKISDLVQPTLQASGVDDITDLVLDLGHKDHVPDGLEILYSYDYVTSLEIKGNKPIAEIPRQVLQLCRLNSLVLNVPVLNYETDTMVELLNKGVQVSLGYRYRDSGYSKTFGLDFIRSVGSNIQKIYFVWSSSGFFDRSGVEWLLDNTDTKIDWLQLKAIENCFFDLHHSDASRGYISSLTVQKNTDDMLCLKLAKDIFLRIEDEHIDHSSGLIKLPEYFQYCVNIEEVHIKVSSEVYCKHKLCIDLEGYWGKMKRLKHFMLTGASIISGVENLPTSITYMILEAKDKILNLESLGRLENLKSLTFFNIGYNQREIPSSFENLTKLNDLNIYGNNIHRLPRNFGRFSKNLNASEFRCNLRNMPNIRITSYDMLSWNNQGMPLMMTQELLRGIRDNPGLRQKKDTIRRF